LLLFTRLAVTKLTPLTKRLGYGVVHELGMFACAVLYQLPLPLVMLGWEAQAWDAAYVWYRALLLWAFAAVYAYLYGRWVVRASRDGLK
jgi:hypothetical protein